MPPKRATPNSSPYGSTGVGGTYWDYYVENFDKFHNAEGQHEWPGDEWGSEPGWSRLFDALFGLARIETWHRAVEIGPGSGKYTLKVLEASSAEVRGYDVSAAFLKVCAQRCEDRLREGRLSLHHISGLESDALLLDLRNSGWAGSLDAIYSIDSMVHVDLQYLIAYIITAGLTLKAGGRLVMTLADATSEEGFNKLLRDISWTYPAQDRPNGKFEWLSPDLVQTVLTRVGFRIEHLAAAPRDLQIVAILDDPERAAPLERFISHS